MYTPSHFALEDGPAAQRIMRKYNFATLVSGTQTDVMASHLPLLWTSQGGQYGSLRGHMARENPQWEQLADGGEVLAIFFIQSCVYFAQLVPIETRCSNLEL